MRGHEPDIRVGSHHDQAENLPAQDDPKAPSDFGIDQAILTFDSKKGASQFAEKLTNNIDNCSSRLVTAKTVRTSKKDAKNPITWTVDQQVEASKTVTYRVGVATSGNHVMYLFANPSDKVDFDVDVWNRIASRATERLKQLA